MKKERVVNKVLSNLPFIKSFYSAINNLIIESKKLQDRINVLNDQLSDLRSVCSNRLHKELFVNDRVAVYTAIIGSYDLLNEVERTDKECDYFCFTDNKNLQSYTWKIIDISDNEYLKGLDNTRKARYIKTHPHLFLKNYKYSLWCDGNLKIKNSLVEMVKLYLLDNQMLTFKHPHRNNVFEEANECIELSKDDESVIYKQIEKYKNDNYNDMNRLVMTNVIFRYNNETVNKFNELWWNEIINGSKRDQLSFNYVVWKLNISYDVCTLNAFNNPYFEYNCHVEKE